MSATKLKQIPEKGLEMKHREHAKKTEEAGDKLFSKGKFKKAFSKYKQALLNNPERQELYDKLIETRDKMDEAWRLEDFIENVSWTMKKQEMDSPLIKQVHAKLTPEWKQATDLVMKIILVEEDKELSEYIKQLLEMGEIGTLALIDILRNFVAKEKQQEKNSVK